MCKYIKFVFCLCLVNFLGIRAQEGQEARDFFFRFVEEDIANAEGWPLPSTSDGGVHGISDSSSGENQTTSTHSYMELENA